MTLDIGESTSYRLRQTGCLQSDMLAKQPAFDCDTYELHVTHLQSQKMDAVMIGKETDSTVADTTAPVAAKKTQTVVRESVSI